MRALLDFDRWPLPVLIIVAVLAIAANVPPLAPLSAWHVTVAAVGGSGFALAFRDRYRKHRDARSLR